MFLLLLVSIVLVIAAAVAFRCVFGQKRSSLPHNSTLLTLFYHMLLIQFHCILSQAYDIIKDPFATEK